MKTATFVTPSHLSSGGLNQLYRKTVPLLDFEIMKRMLHQVLLFTFLLIFLVFTGCNKNATSPITPQTEKGLWAVYTPFDWTHDGRPFQSDYCTIFSDAASDEMKQQLGDIADERFRQILQLFNFQNLSDFKYPPGSSKIEIYLNRNHTEGINWAYWGGFIITIRSSDISGRWIDYSVYIAGHELTHVFEFLIEGRESLGSELWFKEGIATNIGCLASNAFRTIRSLSELESWISQNQNVPGQGNPIKIHQYEDYPEGADQHQYYKFFELAMRYLLDDKGMGKSYQDVLNLFYDLREGKSFPVSFEDHFGISVSEYEDEFCDRLRTYLSIGDR